MFSWTLDRLDAGKKRSISFMAEAEEEGFYITNASVVVYSLHDCPEIASARVAAPAMVGKTVYVHNPHVLAGLVPMRRESVGKEVVLE